MKKTLIASAIAAATFSGSALAQDSNLPTFYGNIQYAAVYNDIKDGPHGIEHRDNGSTVGILHDHAITPDLEGFFKAEFHFDAEANEGDGEDGIYDIDEAYIGVRGDNFGQLWVGKDDSTYERAVDGIAQYYEAADLSIGPDYTTGEDDLIQYMSPSFGGLSIWGAVQFNGDNDARTDGDKSYPWQLAAVYSMDALELAAAVDSNDNGDGDNENTYGVRGTYTLDNLALSAEYHTRDDSYDLFGVQGVYTLGANRFALSYELADADEGDADRDTITLQALHNLSDNMYVYFEGYLGGGDDVYGYNEIDTDGDGENDAFADFSDERSVAAVGAVYYF